MKYVLIAMLAVFIAAPAAAQRDATATIILLRHAEKETSGADPALSPKGLERSYRLPKVLQQYNPDLFYATDYTRTRQTLAPWITATGKPLLLYNADSLAPFAQQLLALAGKTVVVAGHSNTTPQLVNLLLGRETYPQLPDTAYSKLFIITIRNGIAKDTVLNY